MQRVASFVWSQGKLAELGASSYVCVYVYVCVCVWLGDVRSAWHDKNVAVCLQSVC